jgi:large subunit ribosomal protein L4
MKIAVYNQEGKEVEQILLPKEIFGLEINNDLIHQVVVVQTANQRSVIASSKDRGQVRGGGKKPWRQKGTGRARHGSRRSPLWKGGGVTFGPTTDRSYERKINKKMRRKALLMVLSSKAKNNSIFVLDNFDLEKPKTKIVAKIFSNLKIKGSKLVVLPKFEKEKIRAVRNISRTGVVEARNLNVLELLSFKYLVMPKDTIKSIKDMVSK